MSNIDEQKKRITRIFGKDKVPKVSNEILVEYLTYLKKNLAFPCYLTGTEDFPWEERYVFGYGSKKQYEELKKTKPSYTDTFELLSFDDEVDRSYGILTNVKRVSDKRKFTLPLYDLESTDKQSKNYQLLEDYSFWFVNYR